MVSNVNITKIPYYHAASLLNNLHSVVKHFDLGIGGSLSAPSVTNYSTRIVSLRNVLPHREAQLQGTSTILNKIPVF